MVAVILIVLIVQTVELYRGTLKKLMYLIQEEVNKI